MWVNRQHRRSPVLGLDLGITCSSCPLCAITLGTIIHTIYSTFKLWYIESIYTIYNMVYIESIYYIYTTVFIEHIQHLYYSIYGEYLLHLYYGAYKVYTSFILWYIPYWPAWQTQSKDNNPLSGGYFSETSNLTFIKTILFDKIK